jgi:sterol 3beta-glucosyltransferase
VPTPPEDEISHDLKEFVHKAEKDGQKPIYLGFGSMPAPNPKALLDLAVLIVTKLDCYAILCAGWSDLNDLIATDDSPASATKVKVPPTLLIVKEAPHGWLFPRCSTIVHHCGVGTTAATLRAGTPSVPCPVMLDQPFHASLLNTLGVAPTPIQFSGLTSIKLLGAIRQVMSTPSMKEKAMAIAEEIAKEEKERGVAYAVKMIEEAKIPSFWKKS